MRDTRYAPPPTCLTLDEGEAAVLQLHDDAFQGALHHLNVQKLKDHGLGGHGRTIEM